MKIQWKCFWGHKWVFVSRTADWLFGGEYTYQCERCEKVMTCTPYQGW